MENILKSIEFKNIENENTLLSNVLGFEIYKIKQHGNDIMYKVGNKDKWEEKFINIHELAYECKKWAHSNKILIYSRHDNVPNLWQAYINLNITTIHTELGNNEPEAIFKITKWILKNLI